MSILRKISIFTMLFVMTILILAPVNLVITMVTGERK